MRFISSAIAAFSVAVTTCVWAAGGTGAYALDWPVKGEVLLYRSCGAADACWVAEVREQRSQHLRQTLRCDGEVLFYARAAQAPQALGESCDAINASNDKSHKIAERLLALR